MSTEGCGEATAVGGMAVELFQLASLLTGSESQALRLIEEAVSSLQIDPCLDPAEAKAEARRAVVRTALAQIAAAQPAEFAAQALPAADHDPCIQDDDLLAAGVTQDQLRKWLEEQEKPELRKGLRAWLEGLPVAQRVIFVQRAVLGQGNEAAASMLHEAGGERASGWTPLSVSRTFRQALCSLANSLAHAPEVASGQPA